MKKIIFVSKALWVGGIETALVNMLNRIDYSEYDVTCLILNNYTDVADRITDKCELIISDRHDTVSFLKKYKYAKLYDLQTIPANANKIRIFAGYLAKKAAFIESALYTRYIRKNLSNNNYDISVAFCGDACEVAANAIDALKMCSFYHYSDMRRIYHDEIGYKKSKRIFAVSERLCGQLKQYLPQYSEKIEALPNLTNVEYIRKQSNAEFSLNRAKNQLTILSCGRLVQDKGFDLAAEACKTLIEEGYNICWYIVGEGPERKNLETKINQLGLGDYFILEGLQNNPYKYMKQCDIYVQPSRIEAFGLTIIESMIVGKPVVSTKTDGGLELINNNYNGILCDATSESIAEALRSMMDNREIIHKISDNLRSIDFDLHNRIIMKRLYDFFEE